VTHQSPILVQYHSPEQQRRRLPWPEIGLGLALATVLASVIGTAAIVVTFFIPKFLQLFRDFGAEFPLITKALLGLARWWTRGSNGLVVWTIPVVIPIIVAWLNFRRRAQGQPRVRMLLIIAITMMIGALLIFLISVAIVVPVLMLLPRVAVK
jgi:hypothetical protein